MTRVKHSCCWRIDSGPRKGELCKAPAGGIGFPISEYCDKHSRETFNRLFNKDDPNGLWTLGIKHLIDNITKSIGGAHQWERNCHQCSLAIVRSGLLPDTARVARGFHNKVSSQHSWVVIGDPYDDNPIIIDGTLWSYTNTPPEVYLGRGNGHKPHGTGNFWEHGCQLPHPSKPVIRLNKKLSKAATMFLNIVAPDGLDMIGWMVLAKSPMKGWPSKEIITAMANHKDLRPLISIDIVGMVTDLNPGELYK